MRQLILACLAMLGALFGASIALVPSEARAQPVCVPIRVQNLTCFAVGRDNALWRVSFDGASWGAWESQGGTVAGEVSCAGNVIRTDCFARGADGALNQRIMDRREAERWEVLGDAVTGTPNCLRNGADFDCFVRGADNALWRRSGRIGSGWTDWISGGGTLTGNPECVVAGDGRADCMVRNLNGGLSHIACVRGSPCAPWATLDGTFAGRISCVQEAASGAFRPFVCFVRGADNSIFAKRYNGSWGPWERISDRLVPGDPECIRTTGADLVCVVLGASSQLIMIRRTGGTWGAWTNVGTTPVVGNASCFHRESDGNIICAARSTTSRMVVFTVAPGAPVVSQQVGDFEVRAF